MKIGIIGPSEIDKFCKATNLSKEYYLNQISPIGNLLAKTKHEIVIVPDKRSISYHIANIYKENCGDKIIGIIPMDDHEFGIENIDENIVDEIINCVTWRNQAPSFVQNCDILLSFGFGCGTVTEIMSTKHWKLKVYIIEEFITSKLPKEIERDIELIYIKKEEVKNIL